MTALRRTACRRWTLLGVKKGGRMEVMGNSLKRTKFDPFFLAQVEN